MKRKIISIGIVSCFLLTAFFGVSALGLKLETTGALPDFFLKDIVVLPQKFEPGDPVQIWIIVENRGEADAPKSKTALYFDGKFMDDPLDTPSLDIGESIELCKKINWPDDSDPHTIKAEADCLHQIPEIIYWSNVREEQFQATKSRSKNFNMPLLETLLARLPLLQLLKLR